MFNLNKPKPVPEYAADGETERVYHEIRHTLRVSGVNLNFRTWAYFDKFFPMMWDSMRPNCETRAFESAADQIRVDALSAGGSISRTTALAAAGLGESQGWQVRRALRLYHYVNPKLLIFTSAVRLGLKGEMGARGSSADTEIIERGVPQGMYPMEMEEEDPDDKRLRRIFDDIKTTLDLRSINSDYRTLALWPSYLERAWSELKPIIRSEEFRTAADALRDKARTLAAELPYGVDLSRERVKSTGDDADAVVDATERFELLLPPLIINIALLIKDAEPDEARLASPYPARSRSLQGESR